MEVESEWMRVFCPAFKIVLCDLSFSVTFILAFCSCCLVSPPITGQFIACRYSPSRHSWILKNIGATTTISMACAKKNLTPLLPVSRQVNLVITILSIIILWGTHRLSLGHLNSPKGKVAMLTNLGGGDLARKGEKKRANQSLPRSLLW